MTSRKQKEKLLQQELVHSLLLSQKQKDFWLSKMIGLPEKVLDRILDFLKIKNNIINNYIDTVLQNDQAHLYLSELATILKLAKNEAFMIDESKEKEAAEFLLQDNLNQI